MRKLLVLSLACLWAFPASADAGRADSYEVVEKVEQAIALLRNDEEQALEALADPGGEFVWKDSYVFVLDCDADKVVSNPAFPKSVGGNLKQHVDYAGYRFGEDLCSAARAPSGGWVEYFWLPPGAETPVRKLTFVRTARGTSYQVSAGIYDYAVTEPRRYSEGEGA